MCFTRFEIFLEIRHGHVRCHLDDHDIFKKPCGCAMHILKKFCKDIVRSFLIDVAENLYWYQRLSFSLTFF